VTRTFLAIYVGVCGLCDETIHEGDEVEYVDGVLCHSPCAAIEGYHDDEDA
jgi:hypothetical protein